MCIYIICFYCSPFVVDISHEIYTRYCYCLPFMSGYTMKYTPLLLISTFLLSTIITISYDYSIMIGCTTNNTHEWDIPNGAPKYSKYVVYSKIIPTN